MWGLDRGEAEGGDITGMPRRGRGMHVLLMGRKRGVATLRLDEGLLRGLQVGMRIGWHSAAFSRGWR